jgi:alpha-L-fucosidase 2
MKFLPAIALLGASAASLFAESPLTLRYRQPAKTWVEALPVGNGKLGAMIFGGVATERIQFNEQTVWTGAPHDYAHKGAYRSLDKLRDLLWAAKQREAEDLAMKEFMSEPLHQMAYQAFGDLLLDFPGVDAGSVTGYRRALDLDTATATVFFV